VEVHKLPDRAVELARFSFEHLPGKFGKQY
jgi:hypothetical protein